MIVPIVSYLHGTALSVLVENGAGGIRVTGLNSFDGSPGLFPFTSSLSGSNFRPPHSLARICIVASSRG
jgi:hypothetical protein